MSFKQVSFFIGCALAWFVLLPLCVVSGGIALLAYAVFSEVNDVLVGDAKPAVDNADAREMARRVCLGN